MANYLLKAPDSQMERWKEAAKEAGYSFAEWLRAAADAQAGEAVPEKPKKRRKGAARTDLCEHRIPPTSHCAQCD